MLMARRYILRCDECGIFCCLFKLCGQNIFNYNYVIAPDFEFWILIFDVIYAMKQKQNSSMQIVSRITRQLKN